MALTPPLNNKISVLMLEINEHDLPPIPCLYPPAQKGVIFSNELTEAHRYYLDELRARAPADPVAQYALELIAELQDRWFTATDKLHEIEAICRREDA